MKEQITVEQVLKLIDLRQTLVAEYETGKSKLLEVYWQNGKLLWHVKSTGEVNESVVFDKLRHAVNLYNSLP